MPCPRCGHANDATASFCEECGYIWFGAARYEPFIHLERAELARLLGDEAARQRELREAHRLFTEMGAPARAERVTKELAA